MSDHDTLRRFIFENASVRGEIVHLDATWQAVLERHNYPEALRDLLGEMMVAAALLSATIKFKGKLIIQLQGKDPVTLMVVECSSDRELRGIAHHTEDQTTASLQSLVSTGSLVITLEPDQGKERYQGIVEITGNTLAHTLTNYLVRSEQLDTGLWLAANGQCAAGLLIQKLPGSETEHDDNFWSHVLHLSSTIKRKELLKLSAEEIIHRLFYEEDVRIFGSEPICFRCSCTRERVANMLRTLGRDEVRSIISEQSKVGVACEFCNQKYEFDAVDAEQVFAADVTHPMPTTRH